MNNFNLVIIYYGGQVNCPVSDNEYQWEVSHGPMVFEILYICFTYVNVISITMALSHRNDRNRQVLWD
jgi:hypothetical protein